MIFFLALIKIFMTIEDVRANPRMRYLENLIDTVVCFLCLRYLGILYAKTLVLPRQSDHKLSQEDVTATSSGTPSVVPETDKEASPPLQRRTRHAPT